MKSRDKAYTTPQHKVMQLENKIDRKGAPKLNKPPISKGAMSGRVVRG